MRAGEGEASDAFGAAQAALLAGDGSPGEAVAAVASMSDASWADLLAWSRKERVVGLLHAWLSAADLPDDRRRALTREHHVVLAQTLRVESSLRSVAAALGSAGVDWRALKGVVTAHLVYAEPGLRSFVDLDLLIRPVDVERALGALTPLTAEGPAPLAGRARERLRKELTIVDNRGVEVDVHQGVEGALLVSRLPVEPLFDRPQRLVIGGVEVLAPPMPALFVHAVLHSSSVNATASSLADVVRLARTVEPSDLRASRLLDRPATRRIFVWSLARVAARTPLPAAWTEYVHSSAPPRSVSFAFEWVHRAPKRLAAVNLVTEGDRLRRLSETVWPDRAFLEAEGLTRRANVRRLVRKSLS